MNLPKKINDVFDFAVDMANTEGESGYVPEINDVRASITALIEAASIMERCAYTVSRDIDKRGHRWCEPYLDEALPAFRAALAKVWS